ncbi:hypothetical protein QR680_012841 [Steinernema hermaphroditum]|uniref:Uncharacterized protein n=1 Tax=Steinernema hermaphroditum TaxID=289476 RepID=A0AA39M1H7_9BILA|nr:hypothetical protein QR680_012841 [Steinernema hermaphroditum]
MPKEYGSTEYCGPRLKYVGVNSVATPLPSVLASNYIIIVNMREFGGASRSGARNPIRRRDFVCSDDPGAGPVAPRGGAGPTWSQKGPEESDSETSSCSSDLRSAMRSSLPAFFLLAFVALFCVIGSVHSQEFQVADMNGFGGVDDAIAVPFKKGRPKGPLRFGKRAPSSPGGPLRFGKRRADVFQKYLQRVVLPTIFEEQNADM